MAQHNKLASLRNKRFRSVGLSAGLEHFSLFERIKIGANAKKFEKGGDARPNFRAAKIETCLEGVKIRLLRRL